MTTNIVILRFNNREYEDECIQSVLTHTDPSVTPYHLTVIDNFPDRGVACGWNIACQIPADFVCLLNSDTIVEKDWLLRLTKSLEGDVGAVGPITNKCGTNQSGYKKEDKTPELVPTDTLSGFCILFKKKLWDKVKFDEGYYMYAEETQWLEEIKKLGYKLLVNKNVHIYHYGGATAKKAVKDGTLDIEKIKDESRKRFAQFIKEN